MTSALSACQPQRPAEGYPGASDAPRPYSAQGGGAAQRLRPPRWQEFNAAAAWARSARFDSTSHFNGRLRAEVRVPAEFRAAYEQIPEQRQLPEGMRAAIYHFDPANDELVAVLVLSRKDSEWSPLWVQADGTVVERADGALCLRCHAEAQAQPLFGLPIETRGAWASVGSAPDRTPKECPCRARTPNLPTTPDDL